MASITYDGQSLMIDGRRQWMVCATIHAARVPRELWAPRLRAAKQAGFNTVMLPIVWSRHEPRKGAYDFEGDADIRYFVQQAAKTGLHVALRVGPYIGAGIDMGGLPGWLGSSEPAEGRVAALRAGSTPFLDAVARWFGALSEQLRDLQASAPKEGPIVLIQVEHEWLCASDDVAKGYLVELGRFLRESGFSVPLVNANALYQPVETEIDAWSGAEDLFINLRQLRSVRPDQPAFLIEHAPGEPSVWGRASDARHAPDGAAQQRMLAECLAAGAQFNVSRFHEGTNFSFMGGRYADAPDLFATAGAVNACAALGEGGVHTDAYRMIKRVSTFASRFGRIFANADPDYRPVMPAPPAKPTPGAGVSVAHVRGERGDVAFVFDNAPPASGGARNAPVDLLLSDGDPLPVWLGDQRAGWFLLGVHLHARATLDYCNVCAFAQVGRVFVCYGPANAHAVLSINGAVFETSVPNTKTPVIEEHEGIVVVVCSEAQIDAAFATEDAVHIGVSGIDPKFEPIAHPDFRTRITIKADGEIERSTLSNAAVAAAAKGPRAPSLANWARADAGEFVLGASERYASIEAPGPMRVMGATHGYGWVRARISSKAAHKCKTIFPEMEDRSHIFLDGEPAALAGVGPGAARDPITLALPKGDCTLTMLLDNLGRRSGGSMLGESKGLYGHVWEGAAFDLGKPEIQHGPPVSPLTYRAPIMHLREGEVTDARRLTWTFTHRRKSPLFVRAEAWPSIGLVLLNDEPVALLEPSSRLALRLDADRIKGGKNTLQIALMTDHAAGGRTIEDALRDLAPSVEAWEGTLALTEKADLAFAKWEPPDAGAFEPVAKAAIAKSAKHAHPCWWRCSFRTSTREAPLFFDANGLSKGHLFLNGRDLCRYFVATADGKSVPPQQRYYLPEPWLRIDQHNELLIFDEHGAAPTKCKLVYDRRV